MKKQSGFTMIELIMVIVILGILAAVAIPRFSDMGAEARIAKMNAAKAAVISSYMMVHGTWLAKNSPVATALNSTSTNSVVSMEGTPIAFIFDGYPDVGGDGFTNTATTAANSGILKAAGGLADYYFTTETIDIAAGVGTADGTAVKDVLTIAADVNHKACNITYTEPATVGAPPTIGFANLTVANCD